LTSRLINSGEGFEHFFPTVPEVILALRDVFMKQNDFDFLTFSGNGEPTLHPDFPRIVDLTLSMKAYFRSDVKLAVLSNSTTCINPKITEALSKIDLPVMKLDAGNEKTFKRINHGAPSVSFKSIIDGLKSLEWFVIQGMFVQGAINNSTDYEVDSWIERLQELNPLWVQIYSLDRTPANKKLEQVPLSRLRQIADRTEKMTGLTIEVYDKICSKERKWIPTIQATA
jgi:wyosine [tRNA(Phe)-imidazoG37] synthetase (radical SAM superfamily)